MDKHGRLVKTLEAMGNPTRLTIIQRLATPRALHEIDVPQRREGDRDAPLARQTIRWHLDRMIEAGLIDKLELNADEPSNGAYVTNHQRIFSLSEEIRALGRIRPEVEVRAETAVASSRNHASGAWLEDRACLVMLHGLEVPQTFPLQESAGDPPYVIGRRRGLALSLDYDSAVSAENSIIRRSGDGHDIEDIEGSRNGTYVNFERLAAGTPRRLAHGDIVGIGRCLFVYRR